MQTTQHALTLTQTKKKFPAKTHVTFAFVVGMGATKQTLLQVLHARVRQTILDGKPVDSVTVPIPLHFVKGQTPRQARYNKQQWETYLKTYTMTISRSRTNNGIELRMSK